MTVLIPIERIKEGEKFFEPLSTETFQKLVKSIQGSGVLQELIVKESKGYYTLLAGFNRLRAAKEVGLREVPCRVVPEKDMANAIFDTDLLRRQLTEKDIEKHLKEKTNYETKATYLIPEFESIKQYLPTDAVEALSKLPLETQQKFANAIPQKIVPDEEKVKELQNLVNFYKKELEDRQANEKTLEEVNSEYEKLQKEHEILRDATEKKLQGLVKIKTEEIEEQYKLEYTSEEIQKKTEEEKQKIEKVYQKRIDELKKEVNKFSKLRKESDDKLIPLKEQIKKTEQEKKEAEERANKYSQEKKYAVETLQELISTENLTKRLNAMGVQIETLAESLIRIFLVALLRGYLFWT